MDAWINRFVEISNKSEVSMAFATFQVFPYILMAYSVENTCAGGVSSKIAKSISAITWSFANFI